MAATDELIVKPAWPGSITDLFATEAIPKGTYGRGNRGGKFQFAKNGEASTAFANKMLVRIKEHTVSDEGIYVIHVTGDGGTAGPFAMARSAVVAGEFGTVMVKGRVTSQYDKSGNAGTNTAVGSPIAAGDAEAQHVSVAKTASNATQDVVIATAMEVKTADADLEIELLGIGHS